MTADDHYAALGVELNADVDAIRSAYRAAVKKHHPDVGGNTDHFRAIQRAWEVLGSADSRALYDAERAASARQQQQAQRPYRHNHTGYRPAPHTTPTADPLAERQRHALNRRARLATLWAKLAVVDRQVGEIRKMWATNLSANDRAEIRRRHAVLMDEAARYYAEAEHLAGLLGVAEDRWPPLPNLAAFTGPPDELGFEDTPRVWFVEPWDMVTGPLWMRPAWTLRVRAAFWAALVAACFLLVRRSSVIGAGFESTEVTDAVTLWAQSVSPVLVVCVSAVLGAVAWPVLLGVGMLRRVFSRVDSAALRYSATGMVVAAISCGEWWVHPLVGVLWVAVGALIGAASAVARPYVAALVVRWWTASLGARLSEWARSRRHSKGPRATSRRARRRARL